jgi:hypothetical protein
MAATEEIIAALSTAVAGHKRNCFMEAPMFVHLHHHCAYAKRKRQKSPQLNLFS